MANTAFRGPIDIQKTDGTLVNFVDKDGNLVAGVDLIDIKDVNGNEMIEFDAVASAVNYLRLTNAATANPVILSVQGTADKGLEIHNDQSEEILILTPVATAVNQLTIKNSATGSPVLLANDGEDDIGFEFHAKNSEEILKLEATAAAITFVSIKSQATGVNPEISAEGEADLGITLMNDQAEELAIFNCTATSVNELTFNNAATGGNPSISATGGDTNVSLTVTPKGTGYVNVSNGGIQVVAQSVTPNTDSGVASTIEDGAIHVDVGAVTNDANDWIVLPSLANVPVGHQITIACNAGTNFELRTPAASGEKINTVDSDGTQEYLCVDAEVVVITKVSDTDGWSAYDIPALGGVGTATVPDA